MGSSDPSDLANSFQSNSLLREYLYAAFAAISEGIPVSIQLPIKGVFILKVSLS